jgi:aryl-alcohol dehydrogenase-like predicted oxidoreductase
MRFRDLGRTGLRVSEIGFGAWAIGGAAHGNHLGRTEDAESRAAIERALALGINFFDTADVYGHGHSEELLGETLGARRAAVILATKAGSDFYREPVVKNYAPDHLARALERSLARLRTDHVDLYQLHDPPAHVIRDPAVQAAMRGFREQGLARAIGVSVHHLDEALAVAHAGCFDTVQIAYSVAYQWLPNRFLAQAQAAGLGVIAREPLCQGFLTGKYTPDDPFEPGDIRGAWPYDHRKYLWTLAEQMRAYFGERRRTGKTPAEVALQFPLAHPAVSTVIVSMKRPDQVERNCRVVDLPPLSEAELRWLRE